MLVAKAFVRNSCLPIALLAVVGNTLVNYYSNAYFIFVFNYQRFVLYLEVAQAKTTSHCIE